MSPVHTKAQADVPWGGLVVPGSCKASRDLSPLCIGSERCSPLSVAHRDIKFNVLMSRNYRIWEMLINLCLSPWILLSSFLASPPLP